MAPRAAWNPGPQPPLPNRISGLALMLSSKTRGTCFKFLHLPNRSINRLSQPHSLLVETARRPPAGPWGREALCPGSSFCASFPPPPRMGGEGGGCCTHLAPEQTDRKAGAISSGMGAERKEKIEDRAEGFDHLLQAGPQECPLAVWWPRTTSPNPEP